ncbi:MAG: hypothetical protein JRG91_05870 [Deltaproteobacteria bacterium]|nr:hypothetical protein [Deltaproteobacteria bacterium]
MRRTTLVLIPLLLSCGGQRLHGPAGAGGSACEASQEPLAISLQAVKGPGLAAAMSNCSGSDQTLLHDSHLQACRLVLVDEAGQEVESFDTRMVMKFDNRPHEYLFQSLAPGDGIVLHEERFDRRDGGGWELGWGPYSFRKIAPGTYTAHVEWTSTLDAWSVEETGLLETIEGIWTGSVRSNEVEITLR